MKTELFRADYILTSEWPKSPPCLNLSRGIILLSLFGTGKGEDSLILRGCLIEFKFI